MKLFGTLYKKVAVITAAGALCASGAVFAATATAGASPTVINECGTIAGNYVCGTPQWMAAAQTAANNALAVAQAHAAAIKADVCNTSSVILGALGAIAYISPEGAIASWLGGAVIGATPAEIYECWT